MAPKQRGRTAGRGRRVSERLDAAERREQIVEVATRHFHERGYAATTLQDIMSELGLTGAAYYYYYDTKEDVLIEILERAMTATEAVIMRLQADPNISGFEKARRAVVAHAKNIAENQVGAAVLFHDLRAVSPQTLATIRARMVAYNRRFQELFEDAARAGEVRPYDAELTTDLLLGMTNWIYRWYNPARHPPPEQLAELAGELAAYGFAVSPRAPLEEPAVSGWESS